MSYRSAALLIFLLITACSSSRSLSDEPEAPGPDGGRDGSVASDSGISSQDGSIPTQDGTTPTQDGSVAPDASLGGDGAVPAPDAGGGDATIPPLPIGRRPVSEEQAECLGLTTPACAACHTLGGKWFLEVVGVPPPPVGLPASPSLAECGVREP